MTDGTDVPISRAHQRDPRPPSRPDRPGRLAALFAVYLVLLAWVVLWKLEPPYVGEGALRHVKLVPFAATADDGASEPTEVVANVLLFVPFGIYLGHLATSWRWARFACVFAASSLALEVVQWALSIGSADVTDVLVNTAGGFAGLGLVVLARRRLGERTGLVMVRACSAMTVLLVLAAGAVIASPVRYAPMRDVPIPAVSSP